MTRLRPPSGHDIPIPESVFQALQGLEGAIKTQGQAAATWQAGHDKKHADQDLKIEQAIARKGADWGKLIGIVAGAIVSIVGAVRVTTPTPPAPVQVISRDALSVDLEACATLPETTREFCQRQAAERDRLRKGGVPGR